MNNSSQLTLVPRPLVGNGLLACLGAASILGFVALLPLAKQRLQRAESSKPGLVSLSYLKIELGKSPDDSRLRRQVVARTLASGDFRQARMLLEPLWTRNTSSQAVSSETVSLAVDVDFQAWAAIPVGEGPAKQRELERLHTTLQNVVGFQLDVAAAERVALRAGQAGAQRVEADILVDLALRYLPDAGFRLKKADDALLRLERQAAAAQMWAQAAVKENRANGESYALRALERARQADRPQASLALFHALEPRFGRSTGFREQGFALAQGVDDSLALRLAESLLLENPNNMDWLQKVAQLRRWAGTHSAAATPAPSVQPQVLTAEQLAQSAWDLESLAELISDNPDQEELVLKKVQLLKALGRPNRALRVLDTAVTRSFGNSPSLWREKLNLHLREGQFSRAIETLQSMEKQVGSTADDIYLQAELLTNAGEPRQALELLIRHREIQSEPYRRRCAELAWEVGDTPQVYRMLTELSESRSAIPSDYERLWQLDFDSGEYQKAAERSLRAHRLFEEPSSLEQAVLAASALEDDHYLVSVVDRVKQATTDASARNLYFRVEAQAYQRLAQRAMEVPEMLEAERYLERAARVLESAQASAQWQPQRDAELLSALEQQQFSLAVKRDDKLRIAQLYPQLSEQLGARQRVSILHQLERDAEAAELALAQARSLSNSQLDRLALQADAQYLLAEFPRQAVARTSMSHIAGLDTRQLSAQAQYTWGSGLNLRLDLALTELTVAAGQLGQTQTQSELSTQVAARFDNTEITIGSLHSDAVGLQPFGLFSQGLINRSDLNLSLNATVNSRSSETAALRLSGAVDSLALSADVDLGNAFFASGGVSGQLYWGRERRYHGLGSTLNAGVGRTFRVGDHLLANLRAVTYVAPRIAGSQAQGAVPEGTAFGGLGASLTKGNLKLAPVLGRHFSFLVDGQLGWMAPQQAWGWSGHTGLGLSVVGQDLAAITARVSNLIGTSPGQAAYSLQASYAMSQW